MTAIYYIFLVFFTIKRIVRWVQYQGWFLRISTLDRRWQLLILLGPLAVILIILIICVSVGTKTGGYAINQSIRSYQILNIPKYSLNIW